MAPAWQTLQAEPVIVLHVPHTRMPEEAEPTVHFFRDSPQHAKETGRRGGQRACEVRQGCIGAQILPRGGNEDEAQFLGAELHEQRKKSTVEKVGFARAEATCHQQVRQGREVGEVHLSLHILAEGNGKPQHPG